MLFFVLIFFCFNLILVEVGILLQKSQNPKFLHHLLQIIILDGTYMYIDIDRNILYKWLVNNQDTIVP